MFSSIKLFCLLSSVWHVSAMTVPSGFEHLIDGDVQPNLDDYCWSEQLDGCSIIGNFTRTAIGMSFPVNIDCNTGSNNSGGNELQRPRFDEYFHEHFRHVEVIALNGCGVNAANRHSLGIEYIPDPMSVRHLTAEMFKVHGNLTRGPFVHFKNIKTLWLTNNKIDGLNDGSFEGLSQVEELIIQENHIQSLHSSTFKPCSESLKQLVIQESHLNLGELEPLNNLSDLIISTKQMNWTSLTIGINSLSTATVTHVAKIVYNNSAVPRTFKNLTKMEVTFCGLTEFPIDQYPRLVHLNVSHNELKNVSIKEMQMQGLHTLDISHNKFISIDTALLSSLWDLEYFHATHNQIIGVNPKAFQKNYILKEVDLRFNRLKRLNIDSALYLTARHVKFIIDHNMFDCAWVNDYYGVDPHMFTTRFSYVQDVSDVNIRGLRCTYYTDDFRYHSHLYDDDHFHNGMKPKRQYEPIDIRRRNSKKTAFTTICILIVGVSGLLISLFFYVKYRTLTTTLNSNPMYSEKQQQHKVSESRPDIIQARYMIARKYEQPNEVMIPKSPSSPRLHLFTDNHANIEFKDAYGHLSEQRKASLPHTFECVPIRTQKVVFDIEPDTLAN